MVIDREALLALPESERWELLELLAASLADGPDYDLTEEEWAELERRAEAARRDPSTLVPAEDVLRRASAPRAG